MVIMTAEQSATFLPRGRAFSPADLAAMPDDGNRYELIDGTLLVTSAPSWRHQAAVAALWQTLQSSCPPDLRAFVAPLTVTYADDTAVEPDVLVVRRSDLGERFLEGAPVLVVEVLSPSTRRVLIWRSSALARSGQLSGLDRPFPVTIRLAALIDE